MSDVERFYEAARKHFPGAKAWNRLNQFEQIQVIQGINLILGVMTDAG
jgi:hypothetical protein